MKPIVKTILWLTAFSIAMGYLETSVVVYLRKLYYPSGFKFPLVGVTRDIAVTEFWREAATIVMLIGIGVMVFAKHPALQSSALITLIGMLCVVFISFIAQPLLFNWLVLNRRNKGLLPFTAKYILITVVGFFGFLIGSLLITICGIILFTIFPAKIATRKLIFHYIIMYTFRFILACFFNVKKTIVNTHNETFEKPAIIIFFEIMRMESISTRFFRVKTLISNF